MYGLTPSSSNWYQLQPGETTANYYARTQNQTQTAAVAGSPGNGGTPVTTPTSSVPPASSSGYIPVPQINAPGNPNTATGSTFNNDVGTESQIAATSSPQYQQAAQQYNNAYNQEQALQTQAAQAAGSVNNTPGLSLQSATGQSGQIANTLANEEAPLAGLMTAAAAQEAAATGQQGTQQQGLQGAAGLVAPQAANIYGNYSPASGLVTPYATTNGSSGQAAVANASQLAGSAAAGAALVPLKQALDGGQGAVENINSYLAENPSLNSSSLNIANLASQWLSGQYSGANAAQYKVLGDYLTTFATQMAPLLAPTGNATDASNALQQSLVNGQAQGQTISEVLAQLTAEAQATYANRASGAAGGGTVAGGSSVTSPAGGTNPLAVSIFGNS